MKPTYLFLTLAAAGFAWQAPAQAQLEFLSTAPFNSSTNNAPSGSNPLGGLLGSSNPLGGLLGSSNPLGGISGGNLGGLFGSSNPLGGNSGGDLSGLFGGGGGGLGGLFGGGNAGGGSAGGGSGDLTATIQGFINQIGQLAQNPLAALKILQGQSPLGELLKPVEQAMQKNQGEMGLPDFRQASTEALKAEVEMGPLSGTDSFRLQTGQVSNRITLSQTQNLLGTEGQKLQIQGMKAIAKSIGTAGESAQGSAKTSGQVNQFAKQTGQVAQTNAQTSQQSTQAATQVKSAGAKIKAAISTQDAVKGLGTQNDEIARILAGISNQMGGSSNQLSSVASELSGLSQQESQTSAQLGEVAAISGDQAVSLRNLQVTGAVSNLNLREINQTQLGQQRRGAIERQTIATVPSLLPFRVSQ
jgi:hypothetical protein